MRVRRSAYGLEVLAPAKLNLFLEVLGRRDDGFHEIETLMLPVGFYDTLCFSPAPDGRISLICEQASATRRLAAHDSSAQHPSGQPAEILPLGDDNLVIKAVRLLRQRSGASLGAQMRLVKRIPLASGLAGGSSDAAAALMAANIAWKLDWPVERLAGVAAELGSDVPFFLYGGAAICRGRGERIEPLARLAPLSLVVARPPAGLATPAVYRACRPAASPRSVTALVDALRRGQLAQAGKLLYNGLQSAAASLCGWIDRLKQEFAALDCLGHQMSGSGTSYFGLCRHARHAQRIAAALRGRGLGEVYALAG